jgi:hypothetical protein
MPRRGPQQREKILCPGCGCSRSAYLTAKGAWTMHAHDRMGRLCPAVGEDVAAEVRGKRERDQRAELDPGDPKGTP